MPCEDCSTIPFYFQELKDIILQLADRFDRQESYVQRISSKLEDLCSAFHQTTAASYRSPSARSSGKPSFGAARNGFSATAGPRPRISVPSAHGALSNGLSHAYSNNRDNSVSRSQPSALPCPPAQSPAMLQAAGLLSGASESVPINEFAKRSRLNLDNLFLSRLNSQRGGSISTSATTSLSSMPTLLFSGVQNAASSRLSVATDVSSIVPSREANAVVLNNAFSAVERPASTSSLCGVNRRKLRRPFQAVPTPKSSYALSVAPLPAAAEACRALPGPETSDISGVHQLPTLPLLLPSSVPEMDISQTSSVLNEDCGLSAENCDEMANGVLTADEQTTSELTVVCNGISSSDGPPVSIKTELIEQTKPDTLTGADTAAMGDVDVGQITVDDPDETACAQVFSVLKQPVEQTSSYDDVLNGEDDQIRLLMQAYAIEQNHFLENASDQERHVGDSLSQRYRENGTDNLAGFVEEDTGSFSSRLLQDPQVANNLAFHMRYLKREQRPQLERSEISVPSDALVYNSPLFDPLAERVSGSPGSSSDLVCHVCEKLFCSKATYRRHMETVHSRIRYKCPNCPFESKRRDYLYVHIRMNSCQRGKPANGSSDAFTG